MIRSAALLALIATPSQAQNFWPQSLQDLIAYHSQACKLQGGTLSVPPEAVSQAFLFGPEDPAMVFDSSLISCSAAPEMFQAEGIGHELNVFVGEVQHSLVVLDWSLAMDDDRQLLQVTIAGELIGMPEPRTFLMTWDRATASLVTID